MPDRAARIHGSCVAVNGHGVLLLGASGSGKSSLALALMERGALLVADDAVMLSARGNHIMAAPHPDLAGALELYGIGPTRWHHQESAAIALAVEHSDTPERLPEDTLWHWQDLSVPRVRLSFQRPDTASKTLAALALTLGDMSLSPAPGLVGKLA